MTLLLKLIAIVCGSASLFQLGSLVYNYQFSDILFEAFDWYNALVDPLRVILSPLLQYVADYFEVSLPEWWPHALVVWLVSGGIAGRAWAVGENLGDRPDFEDSITGNLIGIAFGPFYFLFGHNEFVLRKN